MNPGKDAALCMKRVRRTFDVRFLIPYPKFCTNDLDSGLAGRIGPALF